MTSYLNSGEILLYRPKFAQEALESIEERRRRRGVSLDRPGDLNRLQRLYYYVAPIYSSFPGVDESMTLGEDLPELFGHFDAEKLTFQDSMIEGAAIRALARELPPFLEMLDSKEVILARRFELRFTDPEDIEPTIVLSFDGRELTRYEDKETP